MPNWFFASSLIGDYLSDVHIVGVGSAFAGLAQPLQTEKIDPPFRAAVMHKFDLVPPAALREQEHGAPILLPQLKGQFGSNPLLRTVHTQPFHALAGRQFEDFHRVKSFVAETELVDCADGRRSFHVLGPPTGEAALLCKCREDFLGRRSDSNAVKNIEHVLVTSAVYFGEKDRHIATLLVAVPWRSSFIGALPGESQNARNDASSGKRTNAVRAPTGQSPSITSLAWTTSSTSPPYCRMTSVVFAT